MRPMFAPPNHSLHDHELIIGLMQQWLHPTLDHLDMRSLFYRSNSAPSQTLPAWTWDQASIDSIFVPPTMVYLDMRSKFRGSNHCSTQAWSAWTLDQALVDPIFVSPNHGPLGQYWMHPIMGNLDMRSRLDGTNIGPTQPLSKWTWDHHWMD